MSSPLTDDTTAPENAARAKRLGHARWLVASNALDAGGRSATDVAIDVLAVLVLGVCAAQMGVLMTLSGLGFLLLGVPIGILVDRHLGPRLLVTTDLAKAALLGTLVLAWCRVAAKISQTHEYVSYRDTPLDVLTGDVDQS